MELFSVSSSRRSRWLEARLCADRRLNFVRERGRMIWATAVVAALTINTFGGNFRMTHALSLRATADETRSRLWNALTLPSGKVSLTAEVFIPEPTDPTAILLQTNSIQKLSASIRSGKANACLLRGSLSALQTFTSEQQQFLGTFPGPVPVIFGEPPKSTASGADNAAIDMEAISKAGAVAILVPVSTVNDSDNEEVVIVDATKASTWVNLCHQAWEAGIQPIPEVCLPAAAVDSWTDADVSKLVDTVSAALDGKDPPALLISIDVPETDPAPEALAGVNAVPPEMDVEGVPVPPSSKALRSRVAILGSIKTKAGENRLSASANRYQDALYSGVILRSECIPGFGFRMDLELMGRFWAACINDLKSTKSKSFSFRSKNNMEKTAATRWASYQKSVMDSGALGDPNDAYSVVDEASGEYKGFA
jgi:hypothetical protein